MTDAKNVPIVTELKIEDIEIKNEKLDKFAKMLNEYKIDIYDYLPVRPAKKVSFIINETSTFANFIRAAIWDGTLIWSLKVETSTIQSSDPFMLFDDLEQKIHAIPINQSFLNTAFDKDGDVVYKKFKANFHVINNTTQLRTVTTRDMKFTYDNHHIPYVCSMIPIFRLQPGKQLSLDMTIERGYGFNDANKFNTVGARQYKILDFPHISEGGPSSLEYNPMKMYISYTTYRNFDNPLDILKIIIDDNITRLNRVLDNVNKFEESKLSIWHDIDVNFVRTETQTKYTMDESYFLMGLISREIYDADSSIEFTTFDPRHLLENTSFVVVQSKNANALMKKSIESNINKLKKIKLIVNK